MGSEEEMIGSGTCKLKMVMMGGRAYYKLIDQPFHNVTTDKKIHTFYMHNISFILIILILFFPMLCYCFMGIHQYVYA